MEELRQTLADRFAQGIRKTFSPCPLIGPKWMQTCPKGKPADFQYIGIRKLAKAIGCSPGRILQKIMPNISLGDLDVDVQVTDDFTVLIKRAAKISQGETQQGPRRPKPKGKGGPNRNKPRKPKPREI
jgi:hypothetical protein